MIYLDNAATTFPKPESVYKALDSYARNSLANPGRAGHKMALASEHTLADGRHRLNQFFNGKGPERFIFTLNCTDALNMAIKGVLKPGDHVITSDMEHNSMSRPLRALELAGVIEWTRIPSDGQGSIDPQTVAKAITPKTRLVGISHGSNVVGTTQPIEEIGKITREKNVLFLVDAAQTAGVLPIDVQAANIDLMALPGHKGLFAPTGVGVLYVAPGVHVNPWREGGTGGDSSSETQPKDYPYFLEGGTPNVLGVAGLIAGLQWVQEQGLKKIHQHEVELVERLWKHLDEIGQFTIVGHRDMSRRVGTLSFFTEALPAAEIGGILDQAFDIAIRPGLHCAPYIHKAFKSYPDGLVRVSPGPFNTEADIDLLAGALKEILA
ncbi:aminotransferase class V-fold PLP-dependent enzyme [Telmatocola sphagniphila]|uniref:cysteine desulfurase n=1 Tax=Telmatocola sphagniphila TaxID=1123043 RepID=A0A8E6B5D6_9BACT|nr:aminotransferase class V-fold PLP-dependent enzyme [Telmatocola sphagniphila]QVL31446.1 aminotransferase class V-fold PLP-dependent enzyme [Telmatocola sphagniphila]